MPARKRHKTASASGGHFKNIRPQRDEGRWDSLFQSLGRIEIVMLIGAVLLMMVLMYTIQSILSPFLVLGAISLVLFFALPIAVAQFESVLNTITQLSNDLNAMIWSSRMVALLEQYGISAEEVRQTVERNFMPKMDNILKDLLEGMLSLVTSMSQLVTQIFYIIIVPFLTFYLLADFRTIKHGLRRLIPGHQRVRLSGYLDRADELIGRYLRGALTVALLQGIAVALLFWLFGIKNALVMGFIAGVLDLVPYFGLIITMVLGGIVALFSEPPVLPKVIFAVASVGTLHLLEVTFLSPRIVGKKVGLHPLLIIFSLLVFAYFLGFIGLLIAIPTTALVILFVREWEAGQRGIPVDQYHSARET